MRPAAKLRGVLIASAIAVVACGAATTSASHRQRPPAVGVRVAGGDWLRFDYDAQRSGVGPEQTGITAGNLKRLRVRVVHIDGTADSSAIELHAVRARGRARDVVVITTTYGKTIAIDAGTGVRLWEYTPSDIASYQGSSQITTATPIADPDRRYVYAASPDGFIHKLALASGREIRGRHWPLRVTFDPHREKIASALNIDGAWLLVTTGGYYGDTPSYQGHVLAVERGSGRIVGVWNALCSDRHYLIDPPHACPDSDAAIWARAGAVVEPGGARILVATGNAPFNGSTDWGDSVLELSADARHLLHNWTPADQASLNQSDTDLGSTAPALLPALDGYRLAVQGGKDGKLHLLDLGRLNGTAGPAGPRLAGEIQDMSSPGGGEVFTAPVVWSHKGRTYVFVADDSGTAAYQLVSGRPPRLQQVWSNGTAGTSPVLAGGLLYVYDESDGSLRIYGPVRGREVASLDAATGHWNSPIVVGGRVILPTGNANDHATSGELFIWHLPGH